VGGVKGFGVSAALVYARRKDEQVTEEEDYR